MFSQVENLPAFAGLSADGAAFAARHIGPTPAEQAAMLHTVGADSLDTLTAQTLPAAIRVEQPLGLGDGWTETQVLEHLRTLAGRNRVLTSLIGQGYYGTVLPAVIGRNILENPAWYTAYTPYQPEISQGRLEALLNFQTMITELTGLDIANASLLDEATAAAEAMALAKRVAKSASNTFFVDADCHPQTIAVRKTRAEPLGARGPGEAWRLTGHKWFFSAPQSDAHLVLAQTPEGLSCFFLPRLLPDGSRNAIQLEQLKDKLGNRSNASCEVEFRDATGWLLGEEGEGVRLILKMAGMTRFDCALGSHGQMRRAFSVALWHAHQRQVMGKNLVDQPLMRQVLAQQALQLEGQTALLMRLARAWSQPAKPHEVAFARLFTPAAKYVICKAGAPFVSESMEVLGGIGYCEASELPRLYRDMPVNSIWEGSGNVMCLDVLRVLSRHAEVTEMLSQEFEAVKGSNRHFDTRWRQLRLRLKNVPEEQARDVTHTLLQLATGAQLLKYSEPPLADAWCQQWLDQRGSHPSEAAVTDRLLARACGR